MQTKVQKVIHGTCYGSQKKKGGKHVLGCSIPCTKEFSANKDRSLLFSRFVQLYCSTTKGSGLLYSTHSLHLLKAREGLVAMYPHSIAGFCAWEEDKLSAIKHANIVFFCVNMNSLG